jgi:hypothetical protein
VRSNSFGGSTDGLGEWVPRSGKRLQRCADPVSYSDGDAWMGLMGLLGLSIGFLFLFDLNKAGI